MSTLHKIFVYGTLKRGEPNHHWFSKVENAVSNFVCEAQTVEKYPLVIATKYNIPFLLFNPGTGHNVQGELYEVDDLALEKLDELEDHPNYYIREQTNVKSNLDETEHTNVWIYFLKNYKNELLEKPMMDFYTNKGTHGLEYIERYLRSEDHDHKAEVYQSESSTISTTVTMISNP